MSTFHGVSYKSLSLSLFSLFTRTELLECFGDQDFLAKLQCVRQAFQVGSSSSDFLMLRTRSLSLWAATHNYLNVIIICRLFFLACRWQCKHYVFCSCCFKCLLLSLFLLESSSLVSSSVCHDDTRGETSRHTPTNLIL